MIETSVNVKVRRFGFLQALMNEEILFGQQKLTDRAEYRVHLQFVMKMAEMLMLPAGFSQ